MQHAYSTQWPPEHKDESHGLGKIHPKLLVIEVQVKCKWAEMKEPQPITVEMTKNTRCSRRPLTHIYITNNRKSVYAFG